MALRACARYASNFRGRALLLVAVCAIFMVSALLVLAARGLTAGSGGQVAVNSAAVQDATAKLKANGCEMRIEAKAAELVPMAHLAPSAIRTTLMRIQCRQVVVLGEAQITAENIDLMNRYPDVDVILLGPTVTDTSLFELSKLAHLGWLRIEATAASQTGLSALRTARPDIRISLCNTGRTVRPFNFPPVPAQTAGRPQPPTVQ